MIGPKLGKVSSSYLLHRNIPEIQREQALAIKIDGSQCIEFLAATVDLRKLWASLINNHEAVLAKYGLLQGHRVSLGELFLPKNKCMFPIKHSKHSLNMRCLSSHSDSVGSVMSECGQLRGFGELFSAFGLATGYPENLMTKCKPSSISFLYIFFHFYMFFIYSQAGGETEQACK